MIYKKISRLTEHVHIAPLSLFRILFGGMMFASILRFSLKGWINELYVKPIFFFKYYGFEWVKVPNETGLYILFALVAISALFIMFGLFYRFSGACLSLKLINPPNWVPYCKEAAPRTTSIRSKASIGVV